MPIRRLHIMIFSVLLLIVCTLVGLFFNGIYVSLQAEETLHAFELVLMVIASHLSQNDGSWPRNWEELEMATLEEHIGGWHWPQDSAPIKKRVRIVFATNTGKVLVTGSEHFSAVQQIPPYYPPSKNRILQLLEVARNSVVVPPE